MGPSVGATIIVNDRPGDRPCRVADVQAVVGKACVHGLATSVSRRTASYKAVRAS